MCWKLINRLTGPWGAKCGIYTLEGNTCGAPLMLLVGSIDADLRAWNIEKLKRFALGGAGATADEEAGEASGSDGGAADGDGDNDGDDAGRLKSFTAGDLPYLESLSRMGKVRFPGLSAGWGGGCRVIRL